MPDPNIPKTYVRPDNTAVLTCPHCTMQRVILADAFKGQKHRLRVKCSCQKVFTVNLEFRSRVRKKVYLKGTYINHSLNDSSGILFVQDISVTGLAFTRVDVKKFKEGDKLTVEFALDDDYNTEVRKDVIVKDVRQNSIGCKFETSEDAFGSPLGYYVISQS